MHDLSTEAIPSRRIKTACKYSLDLERDHLGSEMQRFKFPIFNLKVRFFTDFRGPLFKRIARANRNT